MIETAITFWADIKRYEDMLEADPRSYCFAPLSELYRKLGLLDDAIAVAQKGCSVHPEYAGGFLALASALLDKGRSEEGRTALERVVELSPDNLKAQKLLSQIYVDAGETTLARQALRQVLSQNPDDSESALLLRTLSNDAQEEEEMEEVELVEELTEELEEGEDHALAFGPLDPVEPGGAEAEEFAGLEEVPVLHDFAEVDDVPEEEVAEAFLEELPSDFFEAPAGGHPDLAPPAPAHGKDPLATATMAELYLSQGSPEKALRIYRALLEDEPANLAYSRRAAELERVIAGAVESAPSPGAPEEAAPQAPAAAEAPAEAAPAAHPLAGAAELQQVEILEKWLENIRRRKQHAL